MDESGTKWIDNQKLKRAECSHPL